MALDNLRILVLEDNHHMALILRTILRGFGFQGVVEASDVAGALEVVQTREIDLALVDYQLEGDSGLEFIKAVRADPDPRRNQMPIVVVTAHAERHRVIDAIATGANEVVVKPVSAKVIWERIRTLIERPRKFVRAPSYYGPDRRRKMPSEGPPPARRAEDDDDDGEGDDVVSL